MPVGYYLTYGQHVSQLLRKEATYMHEIGNPHGNTIGEVCGAYAMLDRVSQTLRDPADAICRTCGMLATCLGSVVTTEVVDAGYTSTSQVGMAPLDTCEIRKIGIAFQANGNELTGEMRAQLASAVSGYRRLQDGANPQHSA